uniref:Uncharacterized protein n=1 Tax=Heterorhabditis bacteriophora TaxID=37862 RepID=A0A1I7WSK2_HETBA
MPYYGVEKGKCIILLQFIYLFL